MACASCSHNNQRCTRNCPLRVIFPEESMADYVTVSEVFTIDFIVTMAKIHDRLVQDREKEALRCSLIKNAESLKRNATGPWGELMILKHDYRLLKEQLNELPQGINDEASSSNFLPNNADESYFSNLKRLIELPTWPSLRLSSAHWGRTSNRTPNRKPRQIQNVPIRRWGRKSMRGPPRTARTTIWLLGRMHRFVSIARGRPNNRWGRRSRRTPRVLVDPPAALHPVEAGQNETNTEDFSVG